MRREALPILDLRPPPEPGLPVQVDGDYLGETPMRFEVMPAALRVLVRRDLQSPPFAT